MNRTTYFAFGSNLDIQQMRRRCPRAVLRGRASLRGYRLGFAGHSRTWGGGVATLVRDPESLVEGVLYTLPLDELAVLDRCEGHPFVYQRRRLQVVDQVGRRRRPHVYLLPEPADALPAWGYLAVLWRAYGRHGFDRAPLAEVAFGGAR